VTAGDLLMGRVEDGGVYSLSPRNAKTYYKPVSPPIELKSAKRRFM
jgi:hypothetical protein